MEDAHDDQFVVYVRLDRAHPYPPEDVEQAIMHCSTYEEARLVRQQCQYSAQECVIRYMGPTGGGD